MKTWAVTLTSKGAIEINKNEADDIVSIRADFFYVNRGSLLFANGFISHNNLVGIFAEGCWAMAEREKEKE